MESTALELHVLPREGFRITFENGHSVSVIWHDGAYADGGKTTCEIMPPRELLPEDHGDDVIGHVTAEALAGYLFAAAGLPNKGA